MPMSSETAERTQSAAALDVLVRVVVGGGGPGAEVDVLSGVGRRRRGRHQARLVLDDEVVGLRAEREGGGGGEDEEGGGGERRSGTPP